MQIRKEYSIFSPPNPGLSSSPPKPPAPSYPSTRSLSQDRLVVLNPLVPTLTGMRTKLGDGLGKVKQKFNSKLQKMEEFLVGSSPGTKCSSCLDIYPFHLGMGNCMYGTTKSFEGKHG
uniref:Uncharacterized protein n=1 Tax=Photinus pyralis TaxID=7054 RepID=A0A1Y1KSV9_PHOPY